MTAREFAVWALGGVVAGVLFLLLLAGLEHVSTAAAVWALVGLTVGTAGAQTFKAWAGIW